MGITQLFLPILGFAKTHGDEPDVLAECFCASQTSASNGESHRIEQNQVPDHSQCHGELLKLISVGSAEHVAQEGMTKGKEGILTQDFHFILFY